ncbi:MAG: hypothetical protein IRZ18_06830 [Clostridia bacterium]|nr:hypothetical protein [Clostridia bacterium]
MAEKKRFLLRLDADLYAALEKWAADELRSVNAQIEYLLRDAVRRAGRGGAKRASAGGPARPAPSTDRDPAADGGPAEGDPPAGG